MSIRPVLLGLLLAGVASDARADFLYNPSLPQTVNGLFSPTMTFYDQPDADDYGLWYEYSAWDVFYSPDSGEGNYPDVFAPRGGIAIGTDGQGNTIWAPEVRPSGFPRSPFSNSNPFNPLAFWDTYNATITQVGVNTGAFIIGPADRGNIYTYQSKTRYQLHNFPDYADFSSPYGGDAKLETVVFQFQTEGTNVDFSNIVLKYRSAVDGNIYTLNVFDNETEYLREYRSGLSQSEHWSASAGYSNRTMLQWNLTGVEATGEFWIEWNSLSSSMSFQKADLITASYYEQAMPGSSTWNNSYSSGKWSEGDYWRSYSTPVENGNLKFNNTSAVTVDVDDASHAVGEILFMNAADVTFTTTEGHRLISNTGINVLKSTDPAATSRVYTFDVGYEFGSLNFFEINQGTVIFDREISGGYGFVKSGNGTVILNADNTFTDFIAVQGGDLYLNGTNAYAGTTTVVNGRIFVSDAGALGSGNSAISVGGDSELYLYSEGASSWMGELHLVGDITLSRDISLAAGDLGKRLGARGTTNGATFSGNVSFSGVPSNPDLSGRTAVDKTYLTAQNADDTLIFTGAMTGGSSDKLVTLDGLGTVVYAGVNKTYQTSTLVSSGTLQIAQGTLFTNGGAITVNSGAFLRVDGSVAGAGAIVLQGGNLRVDGIVAGSGGFNFQSGKVTGNGELRRAFTVGSGAVLAPGNSVGHLITGSQTWASGGVYEWEITALTGAGGTDWDFLTIDGNFAVTATEPSPFIVRLLGLDTLVGFDELGTYEWQIGEVTGTVTGFDPSFFNLDTYGWRTDLAGNFSLRIEDGDLYLSYAPIPEPSTWGLLLLSATGMTLLRRRGRAARTASLR